CSIWNYYLKLQIGRTKPNSRAESMRFSLPPRAADDADSADANTDFVVCGAWSALRPVCTTEPSIPDLVRTSTSMSQPQLGFFPLSTVLSSYQAVTPRTTMNTCHWNMRAFALSMRR